MRMILCEDDPEHGRLLEELVRREGPARWVLKQCASVAELERELGLCGWPDVLLMDIRLGADDGIETVKRLAPEASGTQVIYVTGYVEYCTKVYETEHVSFLTKPVQAQELHRALERAAARLERFRREGLTVKEREGIYFLPFPTIRYLESVGRKLQVVCDDRTYTCYASLREVQARLDGRFYQCHKSFVVNLDRLAAFERDQFRLRTGELVPVSARHRTEAKLKFLHVLSDKLS